MNNYELNNKTSPKQNSPKIPSNKIHSPQVSIKKELAKESPKERAKDTRQIEILESPLEKKEVIESKFVS